MDGVVCVVVYFNGWMVFCVVRSTSMDGWCSVCCGLLEWMDGVLCVVVYFKGWMMFCVLWSTSMDGWCSVWCGPPAWMFRVV